MQEEAPQSLSDRIVNILEQVLQQLSDPSGDNDNDNDDDTQEGVAELIVDVHVLDNPNYSEDADVRLLEAELLPLLATDKPHFRRGRKRRRAGNRNVEAHSLFKKKRSYSDEVLCRFRSRSPIRARERTPL